MLVVLKVEAVKNTIAVNARHFYPSKNEHLLNYNVNCLFSVVIILSLTLFKQQRPIFLKLYNHLYCFTKHVRWYM